MVFDVPFDHLESYIVIEETRDGFEFGVNDPAVGPDADHAEFDFAPLVLRTDLGHCNIESVLEPASRSGVPSASP